MCLKVLGGQVPGLYGGIILGGGATHLGESSGASKAKGQFFHTFVTA